MGVNVHLSRGLARVLAVLVACFTVLEACSSQVLDFERKGEFSGTRLFRFGNDAVVQAQGGDASFVWQGFNIRHGSAHRVPWERLELRIGAKAYVVTDEGLGNGALRIDKSVYNGIRVNKVLRLSDDAEPVVIVSPDAEHGDSIISLY